MRALPNQMLERVTSRRFVPVASVSAEGQLSDVLDPDQLVREVPEAEIEKRQRANRSSISISLKPTVWQQKNRNYTFVAHTSK
jgi:hypothetical protein